MDPRFSQIPTLKVYNAIEDVNSAGNQLVMVGTIAAVPPTAYAGIFGVSCILQRTDTPIVYINNGTSDVPAWSVIETSAGFLATLAYNSDATAGPLTIAAAKMVDALLDRNGGATNRSDTTDTAAHIVAAISGAVVGSFFMFTYRNISATAGQLNTLLAGSGVTLSGNVVVAAGQSQQYLGRVTNVGTPAVTLYAVNQLAGALSEVITASTVNTAQITTGATGQGVNLAPKGTDTDIDMEVDAKGAGQVNLGKTSTSPVAIGRGSLKSFINGQTIAALGTTQNSTPTAAQLLGGILTQTGATGAGTVTTPTGAVLSAAVKNVAVGDSFEALFANLGGSQNLVITAGASGMTVIGDATIPTGKNAKLKFVCTGTDTWSCFVIVSA